MRESVRPRVRSRAAVIDALCRYHERASLLSLSLSPSAMSPYHHRATVSMSPLTVRLTSCRRGAVCCMLACVLDPGTNHRGLDYHNRAVLLHLSIGFLVVATSLTALSLASAPHAGPARQLGQVLLRPPAIPCTRPANQPANKRTTIVLRRSVADAHSNGLPCPRQDGTLLVAGSIQEVLEFVMLEGHPGDKEPEPDLMALLLCLPHYTTPAAVMQHLRSLYVVHTFLDSTRFDSIRYQVPASSSRVADPPCTLLQLAILRQQHRHVVRIGELSRAPAALSAGGSLVPARLA